MKKRSFLPTVEPLDDYGGWLSSWARSPSSRPKPAFQPAVEQLEMRIVPAQFLGNLTPFRPAEVHTEFNLEGETTVHTVRSVAFNSIATGRVEFDENGAFDTTEFGGRLRGQLQNDNSELFLEVINTNDGEVTHSGVLEATVATPPDLSLTSFDQFGRGTTIGRRSIATSSSDLHVQQSIEPGQTLEFRVTQVQNVNSVRFGNNSVFRTGKAILRVLESVRDSGLEVTYTDTGGRDLAEQLSSNLNELTSFLQITEYTVTIRASSTANIGDAVVIEFDSFFDPANQQVFPARHDAGRITVQVGSTDASINVDLQIKSEDEADSAFQSTEKQQVPGGTQIVTRALGVSSPHSYNVRLINNGEQPRSFVLKAVENGAGADFEYSFNGQDVTAQITGSGLETEALAKNAVPFFEITAKRNSDALNSDQADTIVQVFADRTDTTVLDAVQAVALLPKADLQIKATFDPDSEFADESVQQETPSGKQIEMINLPSKTPVKFDVKVVNTDDEARTFFLQAVETSSGGVRDFEIMYRDKTTDKPIRDDIIVGNFRTTLLPPGTAQIIEVTIRHLFGESDFTIGTTINTTIEVRAEEDGDEILDAVQASWANGNIIVNTDRDDPDADPKDGAPDIDKNTPGLQTSLRAAIEFANANNLDGIIGFAIPGAGIPTIRVGQSGNGPLPAIRVPLRIDATTQDAGMVELTGGADASFSVRGNNDHGFHIQADRTSVAGFVINNFGGDGIRIENANNIDIQGNYIGTDTNGTARRPNERGINVRNSKNVRIGGNSTRGQGNVISGNKGSGITFVGDGTNSNNVVTGNIIGLAADGVSPLPRGVGGSSSNGGGIVIINEAGVTIGEAGAEFRNTISNNNGDVTITDGDRFHFDDPGFLRMTAGGILVHGGNATGVRVDNNYIGTDKSGTIARVNGTVTTSINGLTSAFGNNGVRVTAGAEATIGQPTARNVVADGIFVSLATATIQDNLLGTDPDGRNALQEVSIAAGKITHIEIKGSTVSVLNNVISHGGAGISITSDSNKVTIQGNAITGNRAESFAQIGIGILEAGGTITIGGHRGSVDQSNSISNNGLGGIKIDNSTAKVQILGNFIDENGGHGVEVASSGNVTVGGEAGTPGDQLGNLISDNQKNGVHIVSQPSKDTFPVDVFGNLITRNEIGVFAESHQRIQIGEQGGKRNAISENRSDGVQLKNREEKQGTLDVGTFILEGNLIDNNGRDGVHFNAEVVLRQSFPVFHIVANEILDNEGDGVFLEKIGGDDRDGGFIRDNTITGNQKNGIVITNPFIAVSKMTNIGILSNRISANQKLGIDRSTGITDFKGVTPNVGGDLIQNFPVLISAASNASATVILGTLSTEANKEYIIQFFSNTQQDASGHGEGQTLLGSKRVRTAGNGRAEIVVRMPKSVNVGSFVSATATQVNGSEIRGSTSEFSNSIEVTQANISDFLDTDLEDNLDEFFAANAVKPDADRDNIPDDEERNAEPGTENDSTVATTVVTGGEKVRLDGKGEQLFDVAIDEAPQELKDKLTEVKIFGPLIQFGVVANEDGKAVVELQISNTLVKNGLFLKLDKDGQPRRDENNQLIVFDFDDETNVGAKITRFEDGAKGLIGGFAVATIFLVDGFKDVDVDDVVDGLIRDPLLFVELFEPEDLIVDNPEDESDGDFSPGDLSLREAVEIANNRSGKDEITFDASAFPQGQNTTITIDQLGKLHLRDDVDIVGNNQVTLDGGNATRHFDVVPNVQALLRGLILHNGHADIGGSILAFGGSKLDIDQVEFHTNRADRAGGALYTAGTAEVHITGSTFANNQSGDMGGAIVSGGGSTMTITNSTLRRNTAQRGAGLFAVLARHVALTGTTLHNNTATEQGGAAYSFAAHLTTTNTTISNNRANQNGGGIFAAQGQLHVTHTTVTGNRSGHGGALQLAQGVLAFLRHSIIVGNLNQAANALLDIGGTVQDRHTAFNLIGTSAHAGGVENNRHGNQTGVRIRRILDPVLRDNGGPTQTHALVAGSIARNGGDPGLAGTLAGDQMGLPRVVGDRIDIGAVEAV